MNTVTIQPFHKSGSPKGNITFQYYMTFDEHNRRLITITGPYSNFKETYDIQGRMMNIFVILMKKSGYNYSPENGKIQMNYSDFLNFELKQFKNITIKNQLL